MQIPANPKFKSLNLSHSVIIIAQLVSSLINLKKIKYFKSKKIKFANKRDIHTQPVFVLKILKREIFLNLVKKSQ